MKQDTGDVDMVKPYCAAWARFLYKHVCSSNSESTGNGRAQTLGVIPQLQSLSMSNLGELWL